MTSFASAGLHAHRSYVVNQHWTRETMPQWAKDHEALKNAQFLRPLTVKGRWRLFVLHQDNFDDIIVRAILFTGITNGYACYAPGDLYIWDPRLTQ